MHIFNIYLYIYEILKYDINNIIYPLIFNIINSKHILIKFLLFF